jgi:hypothetical protein
MASITLRKAWADPMAGSAKPPDRVFACISLLLGSW